MFARLTQRARTSSPEDIAARRLRALAPPVARQPDDLGPETSGADLPRTGAVPAPVASAGHAGAPTIPPPPYAATVDAHAQPDHASEAASTPPAPGDDPDGTERDDPNERAEHDERPRATARARPDRAAPEDDDLPPGYVSVDDPPHPLRALAEHYLRSRGDSRVGGPGLAVAAVVCGAAILVTGFVLLSARPDPGTEPAAPGDLASPAAAGAPAVEPEAAPPAESSPAADLVVHVGGEVAEPGLVTLPAGSRVADAIDAAGGVRSGADPDVTDALNLARHLIDGEQVLVGADPPATAEGGADGAGNGTPIDLNTATAEELQELPGIGPVLSENIVEYRTANGGFASVDQLIEVSGIGDKRLEDLRDRVAVAGVP